MPVAAAKRPKKVAKTNDAKFLPKSVGHVIVYVKDMKKCIAWYRDVLGLACSHESEYWSEFRTEGTTLALHPGADGKGRDTGISFNVGNVDDTVNALRARGVKIVREAQPVCDDIRCASFADPEGNVLGVAGR
jgi:predicted enzyme related to lactoylglutathione lyase